MQDTFRPAIEALLADLKDLENKVAETKRTINRLCELATAPAMFADVEGPSQKALGSLRSDQFYGKVMTTAAREYLELRKQSNRGPAAPREIYEALVEGGFKFDTKSEVNAMTGLRQTLRKNSSIFHKLPNGQYGLMVWYPNAKAAKPEDDDDETEPKGAAQKRPAKGTTKRPTKTAKTKAKPKAAVKAKPAKSEAKTPSPLTSFVLTHLDTDHVQTNDDFKKLAAASSIAWIDGPPSGRQINATLLTLQRQGIATKAASGGWLRAKSAGAA